MSVYILISEMLYIGEKDGAFIYSNNVNKIVELENEYEKERMKESLGLACCFATVALGVLGFLIRAGVL